MGQPPVYPPLTNPIIVAGPQFCAPNYTVTIGDNILFTVQPRLLSLHCRLVLHDANGNPILTICERMSVLKILSLHWRCAVFTGVSCNSKNVFFAGNTEERVCDLKVKRILLKGSCKIYVGESSKAKRQDEWKKSWSTTRVEAKEIE
ncbi:protein LURP-one-related 15-like [Macadamia integrifolia]|uniref:protein LURP-one-related 15-like n=1 Tax=Macadamia integrifolia TaxID=60698 RepID=UPI001C4FA9B5|nr:protein LURP-one-related 15-like [Macadamia integrifolia]